MNELKRIKRFYGEKMAHLCRESFPSILEHPGMLTNIIETHFAHSHELYQDIIDNNLKSKFQRFIYSFTVAKEEPIDLHKTPQELLNEAGYDFYECHSESDIQKFKKYYAPGEELCTFNGGRLDICHVFFAVKKNIDEIKRIDFPNPERDDEYGTSIISIQFNKYANNYLSMKCRYNHTVDNPDCTLKNNLENIVPGLTKAFESTYGIVETNYYIDFEIPNYVVAMNEKFYKYNYEINNIYYCTNNVIVDNGEVIEFDKEKYIVMDYFVLDLVNKKIHLYDRSIADSFIDNMKNIKKININKQTDTKIITILTEDEIGFIITLNNENSIIDIKSNIHQVGDRFLFWNETISGIALPYLEEAGDAFLYSNSKLEEFDLSSLKVVRDKFLFYNEGILTGELPNLQCVGSDFMHYNEKAQIDLPNITEFGGGFLHSNPDMKYQIIENMNNSQSLVRTRR